jgi:L,D-transpeptidase catalytic domain/Putative peptidoglycan binding domain/Sporulation and spore germination
MRMLVVSVLFAVVGTLVADLEPSAASRTAAPKTAVRLVAAPAPKTVDVAFVRKGRLVRVERVVPKGVSPALHALRELVQGPTPDERARGLLSAIRPGVRPRSIRAEEEQWRVSFSRSLFGPATAKTTRTRLAQIAWTLSRLGGPQEYAAISAEGRLATVLRLGVRPGTWRGEEGEKGYPYSVRGIQIRLWQLGYLSRADVNGSYDYATSQALLAFQGWEGLARTGSVTGETQIELVRAGRPRPRGGGSGRRVEIHRDRGVLLLVEGSEVARAVHTSTGAGGATPSGTFRVYRKEILSWSYPFSVWMPFASYFVGGIAMHEYSHVPEYPASHGCVRLPAGDARRVYSFAEVGTPVYVF